MVNASEGGFSGYLGVNDSVFQIKCCLQCCRKQRCPS